MPRIFAGRWIKALVVVVVLTIEVSARKEARMAFRLDDIQDTYLEENQHAIMDVFAEFGVPLTVGVITGPGDGYASDLLKRIQRGDQIEVASHSVTHRDMSKLSFGDQVSEACDSRNRLGELLGVDVSTFIPPMNAWNYDTVEALKRCNYNTFSPQCTVAQTTWGGTNLCTTSMYSDIPTFFPSLNGLRHAPTGASTSTFGSGEWLISVDQLFNATVDDCLHQGICSVPTQLDAMKPFNAGRIWSVVMIHPQDFDYGDTTTIREYFRDVFDIIRDSFDVFSIGNLTLSD